MRAHLPGYTGGPPSKKQLRPPAPRVWLHKALHIVSQFHIRRSELGTTKNQHSKTPKNAPVSTIVCIRRPRALHKSQPKPRVYVNV